MCLMWGAPATGGRVLPQVRVGDYRISTVGDYYPGRDDKGPTTVGADRLYETYVFRIESECGQCEPPCGQGEVGDWCEIDSLGANDVITAEANHMALCRKYAAEAGDQ